MDLKEGSKYPEVLMVLMCGILAMFGGIAKELSKEDEPFRASRFIRKVIVSSFCGVIVGLFAPDFDNKHWVMAAAGVAGVAGVAFLDFCFNILKAVITTLAGKHGNHSNNE